MTEMLMHPGAARPIDAGATPGEPPGAWVARWRWGLTLALTVMIAPTMFGQESMIAPPEPLKGPFAKIVEAAALGLLMLWMIRHRWMPRLNLPMTLGTLFVAFCAMSGYWAADFNGYKSQIQKLVHSYATAIAVYIAIRSRADLETSVLVWKVCSFVYAGLMLAELVVPRHWLPKAEADTMIKGLTFYRIDGPAGHSNWAGFFLGTTMCLQPYFWIRYPTTRARSLLAVCTLFEVGALIEAHVRLGVIGVIVGAAWWVARGGFGSRWKPIVFTLVTVLCAWPLLPATWKARSVDQDMLEADHSIQVRWSLQMESSRLAWENAAFGKGYGGFGRLLYQEGTGLALEQNLHNFDRDGWRRNGSRWIGTVGSHNAYTEILCEAGSLGALLFMGMLFTMFLGVFSSVFRNKGDPSAVQLGMCLEAVTVSVVVMFVIMHAQERRCMWMLLAVASSYMALTRRGLMAPLDSQSVVVPGGAVRSVGAAFAAMMALGGIMFFVTQVTKFGLWPDFIR